MKVLMATPWLFPEGGGLERYAHTIATHLARAGHEVTLVGHALEPVEETREGVRCLGVKPAARLSNTPLSRDIKRQVRRLLRDERPDVVNVHTPVPGTAEMAAREAARAGVPYVVTYHAGRLEGPRGPLALAAWAHRTSLERWLLRNAAARIGVSDYVVQNVFGRAGGVVIPPGVDAGRFQARCPGVPGRILFVGPVDAAYRWKGLETLLGAFEKLAPRVPHAHLRVVGQGDLVERYRARADVHGLGGRIEFVPRVSDEELVREYSKAAVVVLPSLTPAESFGMVLAEANACGRPVVGSDVGGIPFFVHHEQNGLLAPPGDEAQLSSALQRVLSDPKDAERMGYEGRQRVLREHRWEHLAQRTADVLLTAASSRAPQRTEA